MLKLTLVIKQLFQLESEGEVVMDIWNLFIGLLLATQFESQRGVWECGIEFFSKCFLLEKIYIFYFLKINFNTNFEG
jgi:hypothetical protein